MSVRSGRTAQGDDGFLSDGDILKAVGPPLLPPLLGFARQNGGSPRPINVTYAPS